ncbi:DUF6949 family protein [Coralliovum pocilloporae]|uniref:DUF6949 family protein n=1 Tax=Coralliovum pocilloporae TaxID=3066369 RepID=UPI0033076B07
MGAMMYFELMLALYIACTGFVVAGLLGSFYQLVTSEPAGFRFDGPTLPMTALTLVTICIGGPFIIMRNAIRGRRIEGRHIGWLAASAGIAAVWSFCSGLFVLDFVLAFR